MPNPAHVPAAAAALLVILATGTKTAFGLATVEPDWGWVGTSDMYIVMACLVIAFGLIWMVRASHRFKRPAKNT